MKMYLFNNVKYVSADYHPSGSLMIVAEDYPRALEMYKEFLEDLYDNDEHAELPHDLNIEDEAHSLEVSEIYELTNRGYTEVLHAFPFMSCM